MDQLVNIIQKSIDTANAAAIACRIWEDGGDPDPVADTASEAHVATLQALETVAGMYPSFTLDGYPENRLGQLVMAARLLVLAGTDEHGRSDDLEIATRLLEFALEA